MSLELRFTIPGQVERTIPLDQPQVKIGALLSCQIVLRAPGVDPIHALLEDDGKGQWLLTDLGSATGVKINGRHIDVEERIKDGDSISIGSVVLQVAQRREPTLAPPPPGAGLPTPPRNMSTVPPAVPQVAPAPGAIGVVAPTVPAAAKTSEASKTSKTPNLVGGVTVRSDEGAYRRPASEGTTANGRGDRQQDVLFSPRDAKPSGDVLEVVAYWGDTVLDVELFHPTFKGYEKVTIGDPTKAHLIAAGKAHFDRFTLATADTNGYKIYLREGMQARLRRGGKVEKMENDGSQTLGSRDIAHVRYGAVRYFMMMVRPPTLDLPRSGPADPLLLALSLIAFLFYGALVGVAIKHQPSPDKEDKDDIWSIVQVPEKEKPPEKPKPEPEKPKPPVNVAEKKPPTPVKPPPPKPKEKPVKPATPVEKEKVAQTKPVDVPVPVKKPTTVLTENNEKKPPTPTPEKQEKQDSKPAGQLSKLNGVGMPSTGAKAPDFKLAGQSVPNTKLGAAGGVKGSGMNQAGGAIKGRGKADYKGVEGVDNNKASGVNLSKLGLGVGKIMNKAGAGAIATNFKSSAGGAGGGMGSASKTYGLGGPGNGRSLGLAGSGGAVNNFGSGAGGFLSGQGGSGGAGGAGLNGAFGGGGGQGGHGRANVSVPPGDPVMSGGLTAQEILQVIRNNLNQIRHCYEQLLQRSPNAAGKLGVKFIIGLDGRVSSVDVTEATISDSRMRGCVTGAITRWPFPKPRGGQPVTVNYPFVFNPL